MLARFSVYCGTMRTAILLILPLLISSCSFQQAESNDGAAPLNGPSFLVLDLGPDELVVQIELSTRTGAESLLIRNAEEEIILDFQGRRGDTLHWSFPFYDSRLYLLDKPAGAMKGCWLNEAKGPDYIIPISIREGKLMPCVSSTDIGQRYQAHFTPEDTSSAFKAIGLFQDKGSDGVSGTFATEMGDFRFLDGYACGGNLRIGCFDGAHAFLFTARIDHDSILDGMFYSGNHWSAPWVAWKDESFLLRPADELTHVQDSSALWKTPMISPKGDSVSLGEVAEAGQVVMLQVLGTWCPNCLDESRFLAELYHDYGSQGLHVVPLAFEMSSVPSEALATIETYRADLDLPYPIYLGGQKSKSIATSTLSALNHVMSYPTCIIIDRSGNVRRVYTGFYGPGTGELYQDHVQETRALLEELLAEHY